MIEVFKTNVQDNRQASWLLGQLQREFSGYSANFDLDDCDRILRIRFDQGIIDAEAIQHFLQQFGCYAEVLPDEIPLLKVKAGVFAGTGHSTSFICI